MNRFTSFPIAASVSPKCGFSTLKSIDFFLTHGKKIKGSELSSFQTYPFTLKTFLSLDADFKFALCRNPIKRFISAYNDKVVDFNERLQMQMAQSGLHGSIPHRPSFNFFVKNINTYIQLQDIKHHFYPQIKFLGDDPKVYDVVYNTSEINSKLIPQLELITNNYILVDRQNESTHKVKIDDLSTQQRDEIMDMYSMDYNIYGDYF